jgi:hypothetical protein
MIPRLLISIPLLALTACGNGEGDGCRLASDCESGLVCFEGVCQTAGTVKSAMTPDVSEPADATSSDVEPGDTSDAPEDTDDTSAVPTSPCGEQPTGPIAGACTESTGIFEASAGTCAEPTRKLPVAMITMAAEYGFVKMSELANPVLRSGFEKNEIEVALWADGSVGVGCAGDYGWFQTEDDRNADCTPKYGSSKFPLFIPAFQLVIEIHEVTFDFATSRLVGIVDRDKLISDLDPALRSAATNTIEADVDVDGDDVPEWSRVALTICFE